MIIPVRCFTCGKVLADKWEYYKDRCRELEHQTGGVSKKKEAKDTKEKKEIKEIEDDVPMSKYFSEPFKKDILDELGLDRYCCRRHMLGHVDIIDNL